MMNGLRYRLVEGWEQLPKGYKHRSVPGVAVDSRDRVYLLSRIDPRVIVYERDGSFVTSWGEGRFPGRAHGITIGPDDSVYCVDDGDHTVHKFTPGGELLMTLGTSGVASDTGYDITRKSSYDKLMSITHGGPPFNRPTKVAVAPNGELYVSDGYGNARVHRFSSNGKLIQSWGEPGIGPGQFNTPHSICVAADGRVLVADRQNDRIQIFSPDGKYLGQWTDLLRPAALDIDRAGLVYVAEIGWNREARSVVYGVRELPARISVLDSNGSVVARWEPADGGALGNFTQPHGICVDSHGDLYLSSNNPDGCPYSSVAHGGKILPDYYTFQKFARE